MTNKTISINPSLFNIGGSKTKKNREKKTKSTNIPIISPSVLKNKFLKRIKEHKIKETTHLETSKKEETNKKTTEFNDEFNDSINYLQTLSKQKKYDEEKEKNEIIKQNRKKQIAEKTIKNYNLYSEQEEINPHQLSGISLELPEELQVNYQSIIQSEPIIKINTQKQYDVPYGILKGGLKPSYKEWRHTQKNIIVNDPNSSLIIQGGRINNEKSDREKRLNLLKEKIKKKQQEKQQEKINDILITENLIKKPNTIITQPIQQPIQQSIQQPIQQLIQQTIQQPIQQQIQDQNAEQIQDQNAEQIQEQNAGQIIATKQIITKTIKRKYTLGKSQTKRTVGVLIKDKGIRKQILNAQKDLKRRNINDVKTYLREHNLIKIGSNAPNDVLRKLYESAMLSGEITNSNVETLIHNYSKQDKEL
jgi:hypothetical protein